MPGRAAALVLALLALPRRAAAGCAALGLCCPGRDPSCLGTGWRPDGSYGPCYCDQACEHTLDCCHDYARACPVIPCVVSQWSVWSGCAEPCKTTYRVRRRHVIQEPRNGGEVCPPLEERAGCVEYWTQQGTECKQSLIPALITTGGFGKARKKRAAADGNERVGYCVEFQLVAITPACLHSHHSYTHWMQYLREGHTVCVECQHPALDSESLHCYGDGSGSKNLGFGKDKTNGNPRQNTPQKRLCTTKQKGSRTLRLFPEDDSCSHDNTKNLSPLGTSRRTSPTASTRSQELSPHLSNHPAGHHGLGFASCARAAQLPGSSLASDERKSKQI